MLMVSEEQMKEGAGTGWRGVMLPGSLFGDVWSCWGGWRRDEIPSESAGEHGGC